MSNKANNFRKMAEEVNSGKKQEDKENTCRAVEFFISLAENNAKAGKFEKRTTCLVRSGSEYHCQTENDGGGFSIKHLKSVIKNLESQGFEIEFTDKPSGYCPLKISW